MKNKVTFIAALAILLSVTFAQAQTTKDEPVVKILPTNSKGMVKVLYVSNSNQSVKVRFYSNDVFVEDDVDATRFNKGFLKKYDVSEIDAKDYWIEISDDVKSITYKVVRSSDLSRFTSVLEKTTYSQPVLVSVN